MRQSNVGSGPINAFVPPGLDDIDAGEFKLAGDIISLLIGKRIGLLLAGEAARTRRVVDIIIQEIDTQPLLAIRFHPEGATPESLRDAVAVAHAALSDPLVMLLLVVEDAELLSFALLRELEQAVEAAARFGGLRLLFTSAEDFGTMVVQRRLGWLTGCVRTRLTLPNTQGRPAALSSPAVLVEPETAPAQARPRVPLAGSITIGLCAIIAVAFMIHALLPAARRSQITPSPSISMAPMAPKPPVDRPFQIPDQDVPRPIIALPRTPPAPRPPTERAPDTLSPGLAAPAAAVPPPALLMPHGASLLLIARPGDTLSSLYEKVYRGMVAPPFPQVAGLNPPRPRPGTTLVFPAPAAGWPGSRGVAR